MGSFNLLSIRFKHSVCNTYYSKNPFKLRHSDISFNGASDSVCIEQVSLRCALGQSSSLMRKDWRRRVAGTCCGVGWGGGALSWLLYVLVYSNGHPKGGDRNRIYNMKRQNSYSSSFAEAGVLLLQRLGVRMTGLW